MSALCVSYICPTNALHAFNFIALNVSRWLVQRCSLNHFGDDRLAIHCRTCSLRRGDSEKDNFKIHPLFSSIFPYSQDACNWQLGKPRHTPVHIQISGEFEETNAQKRTPFSGTRIFVSFLYFLSLWQTLLESKIVRAKSIVSNFLKVVCLYDHWIFTILIISLAAT